MRRRASQLPPEVLQLVQRVAEESDPVVRRDLLVELLADGPDLIERLARLSELLDGFDVADMVDDIDGGGDADDDQFDDDHLPARRSRRPDSGGWWPASPGPRGRLSAPRAGTRFGTTWWGRAWVEALEQRARLDPNRLPRGRSYARSGAVGPLALGPGEVCAEVQGSRAAPYVVRLRVREFTGDEWRAVLTAIAARASHAAALLDGVLEPAVVDDVARAGIALLPVAGEIGTSCSCPDWANPCKHAAAACYLVADRMDEDPFAILLLRGRSREQALAGLRRLRGGGAAVLAAPPASAQPAPDPGVEARTLPARDGTAALPAPPPPPSRPGLPASLAVDPPAGAPVSGEDLLALATDAARRAWELTRGTGDGGLGLSVEADLARLAAQRLGGSGFDDLARRAGTRPRTLMRAALAWHLGGREAFEVLEGPSWQPPAEVVEEGVAALGAAFGQASASGDRVTHHGLGLQLRYGRDGLWYLLEKRSGAWEMHHPPDADPRRLVALVRRPTPSP